MQDYERDGTGLCVSVETELVFEFLSDRCPDIDEGRSHEHGLCQSSLAGDHEPSLRDFGMFAWPVWLGPINGVSIIYRAGGDYGDCSEWSFSVVCD